MNSYEKKTSKENNDIANLHNAEDTINIDLKSKKFQNNCMTDSIFHKYFNGAENIVSQSSVNSRGSIQG